MSHDNKSILTEANAFVTRGDYEGFLAHCTDDVVWTFVGDQTLTGKAAVRQYMLDTYVEPPVFDVAQLIADENSVVARGEITLKDRNGKSTHYAYCDVWQLRDGKLAELKAYVVELKDKTSPR